MNRSSMPSRLQSIDVWRGLAALAVIAIHMRHDAPGGFREHPFFILWFLSEYGYLGVSLFVVISGFCIHRNSARNAARHGTHALDWMAFWRRRFWRLYPTYLAAIVFTWAVGRWVLDVHHHDTAGFGWDLATHLLLIHNLTEEFSTGMGNGVFWSLGMEEQLYGLYVILFLLVRNGGYFAAVWMAAAVSLGWRLAVPWLAEVQWDVGPFHLGSWYHWPFFYWFHWALGALAVDAHEGNVRLPRWCSSWRSATGLGLAGLALNRVAMDLVAGALERNMPELWTSTLHHVGEMVLALAFFCMVNAGLRNEMAGAFPSMLARIIGPLGRMSYSIYLVHVPVLMSLEHWYPLPPTPAGWVVRGLIYWPVILTVSFVFHRLVERRFLEAGRVRRSAGNGVRADLEQPVGNTVKGVMAE